MPLLIKTGEQKAKWAAFEGDQNANITPQLVKQKTKWCSEVPFLFQAGSDFGHVLKSVILSGRLKWWVKPHRA